MSYKWKPSAAARREFAQRMADPIQRAEYEQRKLDKAAKRRKSSQFDYETAGGSYVPTREQHDFAMTMPGHTFKENHACNMVVYGYSCRESVHHDFIHIVNELMRNQKTPD